LANLIEGEREQELIEMIGSTYDDPLTFVMLAFPWETDPEIQKVKLLEPWASRYGMEFGPDKWICELLDEIGEAVRERGFDGTFPVMPIETSVVSGHGIGKSAATAWLILWIISTRPKSKGTVTATTSDQLKNKTWGELGKWLKKCITRDWFVYNNGKGNMNIYQKDHKESWRCDGQTCREENSEAFAGQHSVDSTSYYIFDEASGVPQKIYEVSDGGLTDGEPMRFLFGNGTKATGDFRESHRKHRADYIRKNIDSREVQITNKEYLEKLISRYGLDSDRVRVRVRGMFPRLSSMQFISETLVDAAYGKNLRKGQYDFAPVIIGVDPAWTGDDDFAIYLRQGLMVKELGIYAKTDDDVLMANIIAGFEDEYHADAVFIDMGWGTGIYSVGKTLGREWRLVPFGGESADPGCKNKRAEMWNNKKEWLIDGGTIPEMPELRDDLISMEFKPTLDGIIQMRSKEEMKKDGIPSPNRADALALTFAAPVLKKVRHHDRGRHQKVKDYDPYANYDN